MDLAIYPVRAARKALELADQGVFAAGFLQRAEAAAVPAMVAVRDIRNPHYLTDLGVRAFKDPMAFFDAHLALNAELRDVRRDDDPDAALRPWVAAWAAGDLSDARLCALFETLAGFVGDWAEALRLASYVAAASREALSYQLALYTATTFASQADRRALEMFDAAARLAPGEATRFMIWIRKAACELKRFHSIAGGTAVLDQALAELEQWRDDGLLSVGDRDVLLAVAANLRGLSCAMRKDWDGALRLLTQAGSEISASDLVMVDPDARGRYRAQIRVNLAQTHWLRGDRATAVRVIEENARLVARDHPYSLSEGLAIASYINYSAGRYAEALRYGAEAERLLVSEATPIRLVSCRKAMIGALHKSGRRSEADWACGLAERDPLGLHELIGDRIDSSAGRVAADSTAGA